MAHLTGLASSHSVIASGAREGVRWGVHIPDEAEGIGESARLGAGPHSRQGRGLGGGRGSDRPITARYDGSVLTAPVIDGIGATLAVSLHTAATMRLAHKGRCHGRRV
jgi:hypothetical protein